MLSCKLILDQCLVASSQGSFGGSTSVHTIGLGMVNHNLQHGHHAAGSAAPQSLIILLFENSHDKLCPLLLLPCQPTRAAFVVCIRHGAVLCRT